MRSNDLIRNCILTLPMFLAACGGELGQEQIENSGGDGSRLAQGTKPSCTQFEPGCGADPIPSAGCYVECSADADCAAGQACEARSINPCPADPNGGAVCQACGMQVQVCVSGTQPPPPPPACTDYEPGCGSNPIPAAGCYDTCTTDVDCPSGKQCEQRSINPCPPNANGGAVCLACGMDVGVCL